MSRILLLYLFIQSALFAAGQTVNDTVVIFDHYERVQWALKFRHSTDALQIIINQDSFLLDARKIGRRMNLKFPIKYLESVLPQRDPTFYYLSRFAGIRIIMGKGDTTGIRIKTVRTREYAKWDNESFDTVLAKSGFTGTHQMFWNLYYHSAERKRAPRRFVDKYKIHSLNLPKLADIKRGRKKKLRRIERNIRYEVNLVTGIITNNKTGKQRKVRNTN